jgi:hypothetical protein
MRKLSATEAGPRSSLKIKGIHKPVGKFRERCNTS